MTKVKVIDPFDNNFAVTTVVITVTHKMGNKIACNTNFLVIRINPDGSRRLILLILIPT
jgi:hypothetical protein